MGLIKRLREKFSRKKTKTSDPFTDEMEETLKAYKVRADMAEEYKSISAFMDHLEEYERRMETEPIPSWELTEIPIARLQTLAVLYPPKLPPCLAEMREKLEESNDA